MSNKGMMHKLNEQGDFVPVAYDPQVLSFIHDGMEIRNPMISACGRFDADPVADYGFAESHTGGGCKALDLRLPDGSLLRLTDESGCNLPDANDLETALIGRFNPLGEQVAWCELGDIPMESDE